MIALIVCAVIAAIALAAIVVVAIRRPAALSAFAPCWALVWGFLASAYQVVGENLGRACLFVMALVAWTGSAWAQGDPPESSIEMPELVSSENFTDMLTTFITYLGPIILIALGGMLAFKGARIGLRWIMGVFGK